MMREFSSLHVSCKKVANKDRKKALQSSAIGNIKCKTFAFLTLFLEVHGPYELREVVVGRAAGAGPVPGVRVRRRSSTATHDDCLVYKTNKSSIITKERLHFK